MITRRRDRIVSVSSSSAELPTSYLSSYWGLESRVDPHELLPCSCAECGISVFVYGPGLVRTALTDYLEGSSDVPQKLRNDFHMAFKAGLSVPPEESAQGPLSLVSGRADVSRERYVDVRWGLESLVDGAEEIERDDLYALRMRRRLRSSVTFRYRTG